MLEDAALYGLAGDTVRSLEPHTEADPAGLLVQLLVGFGAMVGRRDGSAHMEADGARHYPNLFTLLVGATASARKGTAWARVRGVLDGVDSEFLRSNVLTALTTGEGLIYEVRDPVTRQEPVRENGRVVGHDTVQADPGVTDKRLLVQLSEFASVLEVMKRDGNPLSPVVREAWDYGNLRTAAKTSPVRATGAHVAIVGHITAEELERKLDRTEAASGFVNRFLLVCVRRSKLLPDGSAFDPLFLAPNQQMIAKAVMFAQTAGRLERDREARDYWRSIYAGLTEPRPGLLGAALSRAEAQVLRLSLVYALLDLTPVVALPHLQAALAFWRYCEASACYILGDALGDPTADELYRILRAAQDGLTTTEIRDHFGRHGNYTKALSRLEGLGLVRRESRPTAGRSEILWYATKATKATEGGA